MEEKFEKLKRLIAESQGQKDKEKDDELEIADDNLNQEYGVQDIPDGDYNNDEVDYEYDMEDQEQEY